MQPSLASLNILQSAGAEWELGRGVTQRCTNTHGHSWRVMNSHCNGLSLIFKIQQLVKCTLNEKKNSAPKFQPLQIVDFREYNVRWQILTY